MNLLSRLNIVFRDPWVLALIPVIVILMILWNRRRLAGPVVRFSSGEFLTGLRSTIKVRMRRRLIFLRIIAFVLLLIALARPQSPMQETEIISEGIDIVLAIDVSTSMLGEDFMLRGRRQNRLAVVKEVVRDFIKKRQSDRIGMVVFAQRAYTVCPLTLDYDWLLQNLERVQIGMVEDGTAVGSGLTAALNRLVDTRAKGKVIILLTDGRNNAGKISPIIAAEAAKALEVRVYTIGAGTRGKVPFPFKDLYGNTVYRPVQIDIDEDTLKKIADETGALYFRAVDTESLRHVYQAIDRLEKVPIKEKGYFEFRELFLYFLLPAMCLLMIEIFLARTVFLQIP